MARAKRRRGGGRGRPWRAILSLVIAAVAAALYYHHDFSLGNSGDRARIFAAYARLNLSAPALRRMADSPVPPLEKPANARWRRIESVIDGDTVKLDGGQTIRLIGVDTPETGDNASMLRDLDKLRGIADKEQLEALGREAARRTRRLAEGKRCWLEYENTRSDRYGRGLAYIHLEDGGILNEAVLAGGWARVYLNFSFKYKKRYILLQLNAMAERKGFWEGAADSNADKAATAAARAL